MALRLNLPLVALVDDLPNGSDVVSAFSILSDKTIEEIGKEFMEFMEARGYELNYPAEYIGGATDFALLDPVLEMRSNLHWGHHPIKPNAESQLAIVLAALSRDTNLLEKLGSYFQGLQLTDNDEAGKFQMRVSVLSSDITATTQDSLVDIDSATFAPGHWKFDRYLAEPKFYQYLRHGAYKHTLKQSNSAASIEEHVSLESDQIPDDF
ncbi:hypothetical protein BJ085DRAFT_35297 [Dimargaris cristalligena]|uniref:Uncharacterized protein n=1 Tax=Dimargaris cristalligena TaxID=215637 RepID=A0A4P9ZQ28_9FUNG|nr:hypothetical protein BJ085DRAFT_35297 [Dimargaris cristalligena]|eukprot:RKP35427.1 hypothetical protein BJ085DRAFT_35297 [Dimargaris cristalligena]